MGQFYKNSVVISLVINQSQQGVFYLQKWWISVLHSQKRWISWKCTLFIETVTSFYKKLKLAYCVSYKPVVTACLYFTLWEMGTFMSGVNPEKYEKPSLSLKRPYPLTRVKRRDFWSFPSVFPGTHTNPIWRQCLEETWCCFKPHQ